MLKWDITWPLLWSILMLLLSNAEGKVVVISAESSMTELRVSNELLTQDEEVVEEAEIKCIHEKGLDFTQLDMVSTKELEDNTLASCVTHCLTEHPQRSHILISYENRAVVSDGFICICADEAAFYNRTEVLSEGKCDKRCPDNDEYRCGDAGDDVLSVYCLKRGCLPREERLVPVCAVRMPHDPHGCIASAEVSWAHAHNVRNFSADVNDDTACVWECHDHHPSAMYSLTR